MWNKGAAGVLAATREMEGTLPFHLLGFDCDNGSEFEDVNFSVEIILSGTVIICG